MHKPLNTSIQSFNNTKSSIVGSSLGKALGMSTSTKWATILTMIKGVAAHTSGTLTTTDVGGHGDRSALWAYIPENGYYTTGLYLTIPANAIAAAAYKMLYRRVEYTITSATGDGGWLRNNGTSCSHGYIRVDQIGGTREIFGAEWGAIDYTDGWIMHPSGYCLSGNMNYFVDQKKYPYYHTSWYQDAAFWLPCNYKNARYKVVVWYFITG